KNIGDFFRGHSVSFSKLSHVVGKVVGELGRGRRSGLRYGTTLRKVSSEPQVRDDLSNVAGPALEKECGTA
ncbi:MAG TPA: hypothetical protein VGM43_01645, partial [Bryobacteraceae bacterium]